MTDDSTTNVAVTNPDEAADNASLNTKDMRRILASSFIGSAVEFYDFVLYSVAASVVFSKVFFAGLGPGFALFASLATLAVGFVMRPVGGIVFGHFGDKVGRKKMLVLSMFMMGVATTLIGVLPTTATIGIAAPTILVLLRMVQGFAVGGEWGGAALMALEHAPHKKRGFAASFANAGGPFGAVLATLVVSLFTVLAGDEFLTWGWRIPFLLSAVLIVIGLVIRLKVAETPFFQQMLEKEGEKKVPIFDVLTNHKRAVLIALFAAMSFFSCQGLITVWGVSMAVENGVDRTGVLNWKAVGAITTMIVTFVAAKMSDRFGRRRILIIAGVATVIMVYPMLILLTNGTLWGFAVADVLGNGILQGFLYGPIGAFVAEQFPTKLRYTGASLAYQGASMLASGFSPAIAVALVIVAGGSVWLVGVFWIAVLLAGIFAVTRSAEGTKIRLT